MGGYVGSWTVTGTVEASYNAATGEVDMTYFLAGVDNECKAPPVDVPNACGIHVHSGKTCEEHDQVGGHYFSGTSDPWLPVTYTATDYGAWDNAKIGIGLDQDIGGRAVVVHDSTGARIACAVLPLAASTTTTATATSEPTTGTTKPTTTTTTTT